MNIKRSMLLTLPAIALLAAGCTRHISRDISDSGTVAQPEFPHMNEARPAGGTHPSLESLRTVRPGITKDALYVLLGVPHHKEGYGKVREWDYLFNLPRGDQMVKCQYKVIFDKEEHGQSFFWNPAGCAELVAAPVAAVAPQAPRMQSFELSGDALFAFGRHGLDDLLPGGRDEISAIADKLQAASVSRVVVSGYTDLIGSESSNLVLSQKRAETVRAYLISKGVPAAMIAAQGRGENDPVKVCPEMSDRSALVACLQPNRRVKIDAWAQQ